MSVSLIAKVAACRSQLHTPDGSIPNQLDAIGQALGLGALLTGKPLIEQADICYDKLFGGESVKVAVAKGTVVEGVPMSEPEVVVKGSAVRVAPENAAVKAAAEEAAAKAAAEAKVVSVSAAPDVGLWDRSAHANGGPRADQNLCCITACCALPFAACPLHCMAAWGCADAVDKLTRKSPDVPCCPCGPNSKNPLWCCAEPLGWASSFGQLHTVMSLVANGADPYTKNAAGENAFSDAARERHDHVVAWLKQWEAAGKPPAPSNQAMDRGEAGAGAAAGVDTANMQGCYIGACVVPILLTAFWIQPHSADEVRASGMTLIFPWSYTLKRSQVNKSVFELRAHDQNQDWSFHRSGRAFWGSPGWWALQLVPGKCC